MLLDTVIPFVDIYSLSRCDQFLQGIGQKHCMQKSRYGVLTLQLSLGNEKKNAISFCVSLVYVYLCNLKGIRCCKNKYVYELH